MSTASSPIVLVTAARVLPSARPCLTCFGAAISVRSSGESPSRRTAVTACARDPASISPLVALPEGDTAR